jgi:hypothetical protein
VPSFALGIIIGLPGGELITAERAEYFAVAAARLNALFANGSVGCAHG